MAEDLFSIGQAIRSVGRHGLFLAAGVANFPNCSDIGGWSTEGSNVGQEGLTRIDEGAVRLEDRCSPLRFPLVLGVEREDPLHLQSSQEALPSFGNFQGFGEENFRSREINTEERMARMHDRKSQ